MRISRSAIVRSARTSPGEETKTRIVFIALRNGEAPINPASRQCAGLRIGEPVPLFQWVTLADLSRSTQENLERRPAPPPSEGGPTGGLALARLEGDCLDRHSARISAKYAASRLGSGFNNPIRLDAATCPDHVDDWVAIDQPARERSTVRDIPLDAEHGNLDVNKPRIHQRFLDRV